MSARQISACRRPYGAPNTTRRLRRKATTIIRSRETSYGASEFNEEPQYDQVVIEYVPRPLALRVVEEIHEPT